MKKPVLHIIEIEVSGIENYKAKNYPIPIRYRKQVRDEIDSMI